MDEITQKATVKGKRNAALRYILSEEDKGVIAGWKQDLNTTLNLFNVRSFGPIWRSLMTAFQARVSTNNNSMLTKMFREMFPDDREITNDPHLPVSAIFLTANNPPIVS